jgi:nitroreductase
MEFSQSVIDIIRARKSVRSYSDSLLNESEKIKIFNFLNLKQQSPFGTELRLQFIDASDIDPAQLKRLGTYGFISGAKYFIAGAFKKGKDLNEGSNYVDYGYCFERTVLFFTDMGLGTCWLGDTFNKGEFSKKIFAGTEEVVPAVSPVGYPAKKSTAKEKLLRRFAGSDKRKPWSQIFFDGDFTKPLEEKEAGNYKDVLEMVRIAPSASNKQPWRIVFQKDKNTFHFFIQRSKSYPTAYKNLQKIDLGIAMCHFELTCNEVGVKGSWVENQPVILNLPDLCQHINSWQENN